MAGLNQLQASVLSNGFLFLLIMGMAGTTDMTGFRAKLRNHRGIGCGLGTQFLLLPFLGFISVKIFNLPRLFGIMLLIVTSSPGGGFSGWWCSLCNADIALSIAMTTVSTIFSIGLLPLNIFIYVQALYGLAVPINWGGIMISVGVVIGAVFLGLLLGTRWPQHKRWFNRAGTVGGLLNIAVGVTTAGSNSDVDPFGMPWWWYVGVAMPCVLGLIIAFCLARLLRCSKPESVSICIECCYQNTALAIAVAVSVFPPDEAALATLVPLYYGIVEIVLIALFALFAWRSELTYAPRADGLFKCITGNYQPGIDDEIAAPAAAGVEELSPADTTDAVADVVPEDEFAPEPSELLRRDLLVRDVS